MRPRAVVLGAGGMLGSAMRVGLGEGWRVDAIDRERFDATADDPATLPLAGADLVVNCIGLINRHLADAPAERFWQVNAVFPRRLADACQRAGARLVHITTDCVFDGTAGPYGEAAPASATDLYGRSKAAGEPLNAMVLRTSIIGPEASHFYSLLCWFLSVEQAGGYTDHLWNGVTTLELARAVGRLASAGLYRHGLFHVHGEDVSKHELLLMIRDAYGRTTPVAPRPSGQPKDMRLRTRHPEVLDALAIRPLPAQLASLARRSDARGAWHPQVLAHAGGVPA